MKRKILLVEDDADLARGLRFNLEHEGYEVQVIGDGREALAEIRCARCDLVLLDLSLPGLDGTEVLRAARTCGVATPVICLTARGQETDVVMGLGLGADDYVAKPFGLAPLLARIEAVLRRARAGAAAERLELGSCVVDLRAQRARHPDREEALTPVETEILRYLAARRGEAVDRDALLRDLWGLGPRDASRTLDTHVLRLRRKIEPDPDAPRYLTTVHGVGYRLEPPEDATRS